jgi:lipoprotein-releasing system permease protein
MPGVVIGVEMAKNLKVFVGDVLNVVSPLGDLGPTGPVPKARAFRVAATFYSGMYEYDSKFIYIDLRESQDFLTLKGSVTGVEYRLNDIDDVQNVAKNIMGVIGGYPYRTKDWMEMNRNLFSALKLEKIAMFIILNFIVIVASFLIAAVVIVFVIEKSKEISILKTMGASDTSIMKIFVTYGITVGGVGTLVGIGFGVGICKVIETFGIGMDPDVYYISNLPVKVEGFEVFLVGVAALGLSYLATIYPALLAARLKPVEGLRYE